MIDCPPNIVVNCGTNNGAIVDFNVSAHTTYDPNVPVVSTPPSGSFFPDGTTVVTNTATSLAGNSNSCTFTVTVLCDTRIQIARGKNGPVLTWPANGTLESTTKLGGRWDPVTDARAHIPCR